MRIAILILIFNVQFVVANAQIPGQLTFTIHSSGDTIYNVPDEAAEFRGGNEALMSYLKKNIRYPASARRSGIQGPVYVSFIVSKSGEVMETKVLKGISQECDEAARIVIAESPRWQPGKMRGKPVLTRTVLPINFKLPSKDLYEKEIDLVSLVPDNVGWCKGSILLNDGTELKGSMKYNDKIGVLTFQEGSDSRALTPRAVSGFEFWNDITQKQRVFYTFPYEDPQAGFEKPQFFEVMKEFKSFAVLSKVDPVVAERKDITVPGTPDPATGNLGASRYGGTYSEMSQTETIFIMDIKGNIKPYVKIIDKEDSHLFYDASKTKNKMLDEDLLEDHTGNLYSKLQVYAKENKLMFNRKPDLVQILNYYAQLLAQ